MDNKGKVLKTLRKSHLNQAHMCNYCNYTSPKRYLLSRHMKSHSEERPHKCSVCERGFKTLASLQNHVNTHTGTKPHRCKFCHAHFTTSGELVRHVRYRHTHEKPHKVSISFPNRNFFWTNFFLPWLSTRNRITFVSNHETFFVWKILSFLLAQSLLGLFLLFS